MNNHQMPRRLINEQHLQSQRYHLTVKTTEFINKSCTPDSTSLEAAVIRAKSSARSQIGFRIGMFFQCLVAICSAMVCTLSFGQDAPHLLVFTNNSGVKTPYFVYQGQKQFIDSGCRTSQPGLDPFAEPRLRVEATSDWSAGANKPPLGGADRAYASQLTCEAMATIAAVGGDGSGGLAKLMLYRSADNTISVYFSYRNVKQWIGSNSVAGAACRPELESLLRNHYLETATSWSRANEIGGIDRVENLTCDAMLALARVVDEPPSPEQPPPLSPDTPHLLIFVNQSGVKTPYFVYQQKKQFLDSACKSKHRQLDPFANSSLRIESTSDWNGVASRPPLGGSDRSATDQFSCDRMATIAVTGASDGGSEAKLMRYRNKDDTVSIYFSYQNTKQWIGSSQSDGLSCRLQLEELLKNQYLEDTSNWQRANEIAGPNRTEPLSCSAMLALASDENPDPPHSGPELGAGDGAVDLNAPLEPGGEVDRKSPFGINLAAETYWSSAWTFVDVMHKATPWTPNENTGTLELDTNGWVRHLQPQQTATVSVYRNVGGSYPAGEYTVLYNGEGTLEYGRGASLIANSRRKGYERIAVDPSKGRIEVKLTSTNPSNYLRGLRVIMPEGSCANDKAQLCSTDSQCTGAARCLPFTETYRQRLFHPDFIKNLQKFPVVRFMDWGAVNHIRTSDFKDPREDPAVPSKRTWSNRIQPDHHPWQTWFQAGREVPYEVMMRLANDIKADAWISVPHGVDDNYVRELARLVRNRLDVGQIVYLELANEMWNYAFKQGAFLSEARSGAGPMEATLDRSVEVFRIWQQEFGGTSRLVRIIAPQAGWPDAGRKLMQRAKDKGLLSYIDAIAIAPYFGHDWMCEKNDQFASKTVNEIINEIQTNGMALAVDRMREYGKIASLFGKRLIAYEGGQHFALLGKNAAATSCASADVNKDTPRWVSKVYELNNHPGMRGLYSAYLEEWRKAGGQEFLFYNYTGIWNNSGAWGFFQSNDAGVAAVSAKFQGMLNFGASNPKWW